MNILIVDDDKVFLQLLMEFLLFTEHKVIAVTNAQDALHKSKEFEGNFNVVFTDYMMPEMNGIEFMQNYKQKWPQTPFVLMTAGDYNETEWLNNGATCVLKKPLLFDNITGLLNNILDKPLNLCLNALS